MSHERWAVVLSADLTGLGVVRSLARAGVPTAAVAVSASEPVLASRFAQKLLVPEGDADSGLLQTLLSFEPRPAVLFPTSDHFVGFIVRHQQELAPHFALAMPPPGLVEKFLDKADETRLVAAAGIPLPRKVQQLPATVDDLVRVVGLPLILKPRTWADKVRLQRKNLVVHTVEEVAQAYRDYATMLDGLLAQEYTPGPDENLWVCDAVFAEGGRLVSAFTFRKSRTSPAHDGVTAVGVSEVNEDIVKLTAALGRSLGYVGPADVDWKYDSREGRFKYLELNARVGMCNAFGTRFGINIPLDAYNVAAGKSLNASPAPQREGIAYLNVFDDLYSRYKDGESLLRLPFAYVRLFPRPWAFPYWAWDDPHPGLRLASRRAGALLRSFGRKLSRKRNMLTSPGGR
jgi:predicted ATP-grasp superfamily ATP-dependent carboligase